MFSYRHAFHAGSHADVLKHIALVAALSHLTRKATPLLVVDTHAGAGLYRLDGDYARTSGEANDGILKLYEPPRHDEPAPDAIQKVAPAIQEYIDLVAGFNPDPPLRIYPGSPFVIQRLLRAEARDRLKLFELHPSDAKALASNIAQLDAGRQVGVQRADGFEALKALLPPPSRRALVLIDPSYEIKSDYARVAACVEDSLKRFATGVYMVWHPIIARTEAHELPRRLKTLANQAGRPWLAATLSIGAAPEAKRLALPGERAPRPGLSASGLFVVNPPHPLKGALQQALPQLVQRLGRGRGQAFSIAGG